MKLSFLLVVLSLIFNSSFAVNINHNTAISNAEYLKANFNNLYSSDHKRFWSILWDLSNYCEKDCIANPKLTETFISLGLFNQVNSEFTVFIIEQFGTLFINNPTCILDALLKFREENKIKALKLLKKSVGYREDITLIPKTVKQMKLIPKYKSTLELVDIK